jgi:transcriptional regulator with GAF, ATPase, and Fis domain
MNAAEMCPACRKVERLHAVILSCQVCSAEAHRIDWIDPRSAALAESRGQVSGPAGAAAKLGVPTRTLDSKIKRLGIDKYRYKSQ